MPLHFYMGVRVSDAEARLLELRAEAESHFGRHIELPSPLKERAESVHEACLRVFEYKHKRHR